MINLTKKLSTNHFRNSFLVVSALILAVGFFLSANKKLEADNLQSNKQVSKGSCGTVKGSPVINVTQRVVNTVDSGQAGNYWGFDTLNRQIKVYKTSDNTYCALVDYEGKFDSQEGQKSPGNTGVLTGKEDGTFKGGYRATITGAMKEEPELATKGSLGTTDYQCDLKANCPGAFNWVDKYFGPGYRFSYDWWGWEYKYKNLKWINSSDGNSGDII